MSFVCALILGIGAQESFAQSLPSGWQSVDIASGGGGASVDASGIWTVVGSGANIWAGSDEFRFAYVPISGDVDIRARVTSLSASNEWAKAGIMIRDSLNANARNAFMLYSPGLGAAFQQRTALGGITTRVSGGAAVPPMWVRLTRVGTQFTAYRSADGQSWTAVSTATISMPAATFVGLAVTSRDATAAATATFSNVAVEMSATDSATAAPTWTGWTGIDIGSPTPPGSSTEAGGTFTVRGSGADIWAEADQFQFMNRPVRGDLEVIARVANLSNAADRWAKAGVMIRETLAAGSRHALVAGTAGAGVTFQRRVATDNVTYNTGGSRKSVPVWVRLVREGDLFSAYESTNGSSWSLIGTDTIAMSSAVYVGLAVTSHSPGTLTTGKFTNVSLRSVAPGSNQPPTVTLTAPSTGATFWTGATVNLTASAGDADGTINRVEFYSGSALVASDTTSPYGASWSAASSGTYTFTAVAIDNEGARTASAAATVTVDTAVNQVPSVAITSPAASSAFTAPASLVIVATASDPDGFIERVDLYQGTTLLKSDTTNQYSVSWLNVPSGTYQLTAVARDNLGATRTSTPVTVTVGSGGNQLPNVAISAPTAGATFGAGANITIQATASDSDGSVTRVEFYRGTTLIASDTVSPYSATWTNATAGSYSLTARAFDSAGGSSTSAAVNVSVTAAGNQLPSVSLTSPTAGATFTTPASIAMAASASDPDGSIAGVDFYVGSQLIASDTSSPYTASWSNVAAGTYNVFAVARDNSGATRTSTTISITVNPSGTRPTSVEFNASPDHSSTLVTSYTVALRRAGDLLSAPPVATRNLGKPAPVSGVITVDISTTVDPLPTGSYYAVVMAVGPTGSSTSTASASFSK